MQTTFIVKNLTETALEKVCAMTPADAHAQLAKWAFGDLRHCVSQKCGTGQFGDRVNWNSALKSGKPLSFKMEARRGYKLFTFSVEGA